MNCLIEVDELFEPMITTEMFAQELSADQLNVKDDDSQF